MPLKHAKFGIETNMLCEAESGYGWSSIIYTWKGTTLDEQKDLPVSSQVVMSHEIFDRQMILLNHHNFYSLLQLAAVYLHR
jgi:hypothetical protein